jgi:hypothetical protein
MLPSRNSWRIVNNQEHGQCFLQMVVLGLYVGVMAAATKYYDMVRCLGALKLVVWMAFEEAGHGDLFC